MDKRRREVIHTVQITVRLSPEDNVDLKGIAEEEQIPVAILARNWITSELKRRKAKHGHVSHNSDDDTPA